MNAEISETIRARLLGLGVQIPELLTWRADSWASYAANSWASYAAQEALEIPAQRKFKKVEIWCVGTWHAHSWGSYAAQVCFSFLRSASLFQYAAQVCFSRRSASLFQQRSQRKFVSAMWQRKFVSAECNVGTWNADSWSSETCGF